MTPEQTDRRVIIEAAARACHEVNRAYAFAIEDAYVQPPWTNTAPEIQESAREGVRGVLFDGNTPRESHESWSRFKLNNGWTYGPTRDDAKKLHPCLVSYDELPEAQRRKDALFVTTAKAVATALGWQEANDAG